MPVTILLDKRNLFAFKRDMQRLALDFAGTNRMRQPLLKAAREVIAPSINKSFTVGGRPTRWKTATANSPYRAKKGRPNARTLWVTGKMKRSASAFARFNVRQNTLTYGRFPPTLWYAAVHDNAELAARADIPQRPFALFQAEDIPKIMNIFADWVESRVNAHIRLRYV